MAFDYDDADFRHKRINALRAGGFLFRPGRELGGERLFANAAEETREKVFRQLIYPLKDLGEDRDCAVAAVAPGPTERSPLWSARRTGAASQR